MNIPYRFLYKIGIYNFPKENRVPSDRIALSELRKAPRPIPQSLGPHTERFRFAPDGRLLYKGYLYDPFLGIYCLGERHYAPWACRFIEPDRTEYVDPGESLCRNLYAYCGNDPIAHSDPSGHMPEWGWFSGRF